MKMTTMCYITGPDGILMLHRVSKELDMNKGKWVGVGGKFENGESPAQCVIREIREETGLNPLDVRLAALITFNFLDPDPSLADWDTEYMFVFVCDQFEGEVDFTCNEGNLAWVLEEVLPSLPMWEGDALFMAPVLGGAPFFSMKMIYRGDTLISWNLD